MRLLRIFFAIVLSAGLFLCGGCARSDNSAENLLCEICASLSLPAGRLYLRGADEGSENFLSLDTMSVMYGNEAENDFAVIEDFAIYVSEVALPCEVAVFRCYSSSDTDTVAAMCLERADMIKVLLKDTGLAELCEGTEVVVRGHYVVMLVTDAPAEARSAARKALG